MPNRKDNDRFIACDYGVHQQGQQPPVSRMVLKQVQVGTCIRHIGRRDTQMEKGILFIGHSIEPDKRIIVGVQGAGLHASILTIDEAIKAQEHLMRTIEMLKSSKAPKK